MQVLGYNICCTGTVFECKTCRYWVVTRCTEYTGAGAQWGRMDVAVLCFIV